MMRACVLCLRNVVRCVQETCNAALGPFAEQQQVRQQQCHLQAAVQSVAITTQWSCVSRCNSISVGSTVTHFATTLIQQHYSNSRLAVVQSHAGYSTNNANHSCSDAVEDIASQQQPQPLPAGAGPRKRSRQQRWRPTEAQQHRSGGGGDSSRSSGSLDNQQQVKTPQELTRAIKRAIHPGELLQLVQRHAADMNHINLSAAYTQAVKLCRNRGGAPQQLLSVLHQLAEQLQQQCEARQLANIIWSCWHLRSRETAQLLLLLFVQDSILQQADPQALSNTLWAAAKFGEHLPLQTLQRLLLRFTELLPEANTQDVANTLWAVATMGQKLPAQQLQPLLLRFTELLPEANPQNVSNTLWAVATMGQQLPAQQLQRMLQRFTELLPEAKPQNVCNTLWAVVTMGQQLPAQQLQPLLLRLTELLPEAKAQEVSNTLWAVATMGQKPPTQQLQPLLLRFTELLPQANAQDLSNTLWAVATMGQQLPAQQLQPLLLRFTELLPEAKAQEVSNTLWAVATMGQKAPAQQLQPLLLRFTELLPQAKPQEASNTLWACGHLRYAPLQLMSALQQQTQQLQSLLATASAQELANMAWACGCLGQPQDKGLTGAVLQQAVQLLLQDNNKATCSFNMQELCNLCWAAAVQDLQQYLPHVLQLAAVATKLWHTAIEADLHQLYQVHLWLLDSQLPGSAAGGGLLGVLSQQQLQQCLDSWEQQLAADAAQSKASHTQQSVFAAVQQLPAGTWQQLPVMEQRTVDGAFSIDIAATTAAGAHVAIEVDGPYHFVQPGNTLDGPSQSRNRALAARGYCVISIPYWEWDALETHQQEQEYLQGKLQAAL